MKRLALTLCLAGAALVAGGGVARPAATMASACVGSRPGCFPTIQAAVDAVDSVVPIQVDAGTYAGGITVRRSATILGAGAGKTIIRGGGPAIAIGTPGAENQSTVTISGVTITAGLTSSSPVSNNTPGVDAAGGGIEVLPLSTLTLSDSVVAGNRVEPSATVISPHSAECPAGKCPYASARGGGIANWGTLTVRNTTVSGNAVGGPLASDATGGGIWSAANVSVTLADAVVTQNHATAVAPNGRFAEGGGIFVEDSGRLKIGNSVVSGNSASLTSNLPSFADKTGKTLIDMNANSGGVHVNDGATATIDSATIQGNTVSAKDPAGEPLAFDAAMYAGDARVVMRNSFISRNDVTVTSATAHDVGSGGSALELDGGGTISGTRITDNSAEAISPAGEAQVNGGLAVLNFNHDAKLVLVKNSVISGNTATASTTTGSASVKGGGIFNGSLLELRHVRVSGNTGTAAGPAGVAQGGGVWNGRFTDSPVRLTLKNTAITHNSLAGSSGIARRGGGLFTTFRVKRSHTRLALNSPDQCAGC